MAYFYTGARYEELNNIVRTGSKWEFYAGAMDLTPWHEMCVEFNSDTYEIKETLKAAGARWNRERKTWRIAVKDTETAQRIVRRSRYADRKATEAGRANAAKAWIAAWNSWTDAPKTFKISLAKLAQAAAARLAAAAQAKAEAAKAAEPACKISLRPVVAAAVKGAAHAVRSARAKRGWETRRRNAAAHAVRSARAKRGWETRRRNAAAHAARAAEILSATCEPLVTTSYSATPGSECCHGRAAHGTCGRVVARADVWCDRGTVVTNGKDDVQILVDHTLRRVDTSRCPHVTPCDPRDTWAVMFDSLCRTPAEGRRERRNARRRELYRLRKASLSRLEKGRDEEEGGKK